MKNIILQHWTGPMNELTTLSSANISKYADSIGAGYRLLRGDVFRPNLPNSWPPVQKLHLLDKEFDNYDIVVMLDPDMFTRKGMTKNIFTDVNGVGLHQDVQKRLLREAPKRLGKYGDSKAPWWGGAVYKMDKPLRQLLRSQLSEEEIDFFCTRKHCGDEGLMHRLASLAKVNPKGTYFPDNTWCYCSFLKPMERANLIHIRTKITPKGPERKKIENYHNLVQQGYIEKA